MNRSEALTRLRALMAELESSAPGPTTLGLSFVEGAALDLIDAFPDIDRALFDDASPERIIDAGRLVYRLSPSGLAADVVIRQVAVGLGLDHRDYDDLVRHLVTADEVDEDAYRWAVSG